MLLPEEILVREFLPNLRGALAHLLKEKGLSQPKIANVLKVTQAAVSQYLSSPLEEHLKNLKKLGIPEGDLKVLLDSLSGERMLDPVRQIEAISAAWRVFLGKGYLCAYHRSLHPELEGCEVCIASYGGEERPERTKVLMKVAESVRTLEETPFMTALAPEVGINVAEAMGGATSISDVAAVPGRIVRALSSLRAVSRPAFGSSTHLASILVALRPIHNKVRSVMNLRYDDSVERALKMSGLKYATVGGGREEVDEAEVVKRVSEKVLSDPTLDVVVDKGGIGYEPATYVFGSDASEVTKKALKLARVLLSAQALS